MFEFTKNTMWIYAMFGMGIIIVIAKYIDDITNINARRRLASKFFRQYKRD